MNEMIGVEMIDNLKIQIDKKAMINGPVLVLTPHLVMVLGGVAEGLLYRQIAFRTGKFNTIDTENKTVRFSYTKLQQQFPFFTRRWLITIIERLERMNMVYVIRNGGVNEYSCDTTGPVFVNAVESTDRNKASMLVFPELACKAGLLEAIALQQIHIRHHGHDGSTFVIRTLEQWHAEVFMFLGIATVKRLFARLEKKNLIFVKPYKSETGIINSYRVNYIKVAEVLGVPVQFVPNPYAENDNCLAPKPSDWTDPLNPIKKSTKKTGSDGVIHLAH